LINTEAIAQPLIRGTAARLLAATALATFPNTAVTEPTSQDRRDATSATVRRAIAYIEQHPNADVSVADIAAAANVSIRTVQFAFRRYLHVTPMEYLRSVRLDRVHSELLAADPFGDTTVTDIATRWGFCNHSRFAARYRRAYGATPHDTLRSG
jgi:transcriptional regulator GlxA family with amidase domain